MKHAGRGVRLILTATWLVCGPLAAAASPQGAAGGEEDAEPLVVMIQSKLAGGDSIGAGIIFGAGPDTLYVATANHVVRRGEHEAQDIQVQFRWLDKPVRATLLKQHAGDPLDLAVLSVAGLKQQGIDPSAVPFARMGDAASLSRGEAVYSLGNARAVKWSVNVTPDKVSRVEKDFIAYESNFIGPGHSGGALLNERQQVVGMILSDAPPNGRAASIASVLGRLKGWGLPVNLRAPNPHLSAGHEVTCQVAPGGAARCWGDMNGLEFSGGGGEVEFGVMPIQGTRFKSISVGYHVCGLAFNGAAYCVGQNGNGQLGNGTTTVKYKVPVAVQGGMSFASISAGAWHTCALTKEGSAYCWGRGDTGALGNGSMQDSPVPSPVAGGHTFKEISAGYTETCALTAGGAAYCWGLNYDVEPEAVPGGLTFKTISVGNVSACGVTAGGAAYCWGAGSSAGRLDSGSEEYTDKPRPVLGRLTFKSVSAPKGDHGCGVTTGGAAYCWGGNNNGELGNGTRKGSRVPVAVSGGLTFESISVGYNHTCGVTTDGATYCWGDQEVIGTGTDPKAATPSPARMPGSP